MDPPKTKGSSPLHDGQDRETLHREQAYFNTRSIPAAAQGPVWPRSFGV